MLQARQSMTRTSLLCVHGHSFSLAADSTCSTNAHLIGHLSSKQQNLSTIAVKPRLDLTMHSLWAFWQPDTMTHEADDRSAKLDVDFCLQQVSATIRLWICQDLLAACRCTC